MADRLLIPSIHDVSPLTEDAVTRLADHMAGWLGDVRPALLAVPDHWGQAPLRAGTPFAGRLRHWSDAGHEIFLHGWYHRDGGGHARPFDRFRAARMTAGEGEFLSLDRVEAAQRLANGRALIEDIIGRPIAGFVAPAWLYGDGARAALADLGFPLAEDHLTVWRPMSGERLSRSPVITWASRSRLRTASSLLAAWAARLALRRIRHVRIAVHPGDTTRPEIMDSISRTLSRFAATHRPAPYAALASAAAI